MGGDSMGLDENQKINEYMNNVCSQIKNLKVHREVREEVEGHIEEITQEYVEGGFSVEEAVNKAVAQMGDASLIGKELNKIHKQKPEWSIVILSSIFAVIGLAVIFLMDFNGILTYSIFSKSIIGTLIGLACAALLYYFDYMKIKDYSRFIYAITAALVLITIIFGRQVNGKAFLFIGIGINFIDISPFLFSIALAGILNQLDWRETKKALYGVILLAVPAFLMLGGRSLSAMACYSAAAIVLLFTSGVKIKHISIMITSCMALFMFYVLKEPYRIKRLLTYLNPEQDPQGMGYLNIQLDKIIDSAGLLGQGFTFDGKMLPDVHTDFIFTYIIYTFGWMAGVLLAVLVVLFLIKMSHTVRYVKSSYGKLLISGIVAIFAVQFMWNILMNLSLLPITGMGLPFISYGNTQFVVNMAAIGLISNIYKQRNLTAGKAC
jgi:cell division protein FtsW (lipid II flippase)